MRNIKTIFNEDQKDRQNFDLMPEEMTRRDTNRRKEVWNLIEQRAIQTGVDFYYAAFIFHHGLSKADSQQAMKLAKKSIGLKYPKAKWLYAAAIDRLLIKEGKPQKYGTQYEKKKGGKWKLLPLDRKTTDTERAKFNIAPVSQLIKQIEELNQAEKTKS